MLDVFQLLMLTDGLGIIFILTAPIHCSASIAAETLMQKHTQPDLGRPKGEDLYVHVWLNSSFNSHIL